MPIPEFIQALRKKIGRDLLFMPGAGAVVVNDAGEVLLQQDPTGRWRVPGGIVEPGEEPADAVVRELREECGIEIEPVRISGVYATAVITYPNGDRAQFIGTVFRCRLVSGTPRVCDDESLDFRFFPADRLPELSPAHRLRIEHALADKPEAFFHRNTGHT